jgi:hypothetical protein
MRTLVLVLAVIGLGGVAQAKDPPKKPAVPQHLSFDDDVVEADLARPDDGVVGALHHRSHERLIRVRQNFIPEMMQSCEAI